MRGCAVYIDTSSLRRVDRYWYERTMCFVCGHETNRLTSLKEILFQAQYISSWELHGLQPHLGVAKVLRLVITYVHAA